MARPRLDDAFGRRWTARVVTITAGAGFGKSTLVAQAMKNHDHRRGGIDCWLACEPADSDADHLADGVRTALHHRLHDGAVTPLSGRTADDDLDPVAAFTSAIWAQAPRQISIVFDDVHEIAQGSSGAGLLEALIQSLPGNGHVVLVGRHAAPVALTRLRATGQIVELTEADLAFTASEIAEFAGLRGTETSRLDGFGGWPALVELSAGSRHLDADVEAFIVEEVLADHAPDEIELIETLALISGADHELLGSAVGRAVDRRELSELLVGLPLAQRGDDGWWKLHPLWTTAVEARLGDQRRRRLQSMAGRALNSRDPTTALGLLIDAGDDDGIATALHAAARTPWSSPVPPIARQLYARLPEHLARTSDARLLLASSSAASAPVDAIQMLRSIADEAEADGDTATAVAAIERLVVIASRRQDVAEFTDAFDRIARLDHPTDRSHELTTLGAALRADARGEAGEVLVALARLHPERLDPYWRSPILWMRAQATMSLGYPDAALEDSTAALDLAPAALRGELAMLQANILAFTGRPDASAAVLREAVALLDAHGSIEARAMVRGQSAQFAALRGDIRAAQHQLAEAVEMAGPAAPPPVRATLAAATVLLAVAEMDEASAAASMAAALADQPLEPGRQLYSYRRRLPALYVLAPETREAWDRTELGPVFRLSRDLARALVAIRTTGDLGPAQRLTGAHWSVAPACLAVPWICELAVAASIDTSSDARLALDAIDSTRSQPVIKAIAAREPNRLLSRRARSLLGAMPSIPPRRLRIEALGPLAVAHDDDPVDHPAWRRERVRMLLAFLLCHRRTTREQAALALWPDLDTAAAGRNLRVTLSYLLSVIEPDRSSRDPSYFVRTDGSRLELTGGDLLLVDLDDFSDAVEDTAEMTRRGAPADELARLLDAVSVYRDTPFADLGPEEWLIDTRDHITARFVRSAVRAGELSTAVGEHEQARALAERAIAAEPWSEAARRLLAVAHLELGDRAAARRSLQACWTMLDELGVEPEAATMDVDRRIASGFDTAQTVR